ncbi:MAG: SAM-dependent methyltransferase [Myxococcota bacterium]|jgi:SAM-dependent methyltransferase
MDSETPLSDRLRWTLSWQTQNLMPLLVEPGVEERLRDYWIETRRMDTVLDRTGLHSGSVSVDIGGGLTTALRWLPGKRVCIDPLAAHYAARFDLPHERVEYRTGSGELLPLKSGTVDLVICTNCIDHTNDPWAVIAEVERVLRPGGWLWLTCEIRPPEKARNPGHPHALDRASLCSMVSGFETVLSWEEPWRGVLRYLQGREPFTAVEFGFLLRRGASDDVG